MLTNRLIKSLTPQAQDFQVADGGGLFLRIRASGSKTFFLEIRHGGRRIKRSLGQWPAMSLEQARSERARLADMQARGTSFETVSRAWYDAKSAGWSPKRRECVLGSLNRYLLPTLKHLAVSEITPQTLLAAVSAAPPAAARAAVQIANTVLYYAVNIGHMPFNPCAAVMSAMPAHAVQHRPAVEWQELPALARALRAHELDRMYRLQFAFLLCSMLRRNEMATLRWEYVQDDIITIPGERMKNHLQHRVPLVGFLAELLAAQREIAAQIDPDSPFVWPSPKAPGRPVSSYMLYYTLRKLGYDGRMTLHGMRSTARSWMAEQGYDFAACERCLAHVERSQVVRAYQRADLLTQRREIMRAWGEVLRPDFSFVLDISRD